jgi:hypothetical protein
MTMSPFDQQPDEELGRMLREQLTGPAPQAFLRRLRLAVAGAERGDQWDVLSGWARPRAMAMAVAAGLLLWLGAWVAGALQPAGPGVTMVSLPAHTVVTGQAPAVDVFMLAMREGR